jgi:hypothetical protein
MISGAIKGKMPLVNLTHANLLIEKDQDRILMDYHHAKQCFRHDGSILAMAQKNVRIT